MTTLQVKENTNVNANGNLSFYCYVTLKDSEQILIDVEVKEWTNGRCQGTGVFKKFRLENLCYQSSGRNNDETVSLHSLEVRGFRKDKGLRYRTERLFRLDKEMIDQIPDHYHNYAREAFVKEAVKLQQQLTTMTNEGVKIEPRN